MSGRWGVAGGGDELGERGLLTLTLKAANFLQFFLDVATAIDEIPGEYCKVQDESWDRWVLFYDVKGQKMSTKMRA